MQRRPLTLGLALASALFACFFLLVPPTRADGPVYVRRDATGANNGTSWANAYTDLSVAIANTASGDIWVATGVYTPTLPTNPADPRTATFQLKDWMALYGGFAGDETSLDQRDWAHNVTILSGDLLGNDVGPVSITNTTWGDNAYHVIYYPGWFTPRLDGFRVTAGNANGSGSFREAGGAICIVHGSPALANCVFRANAAIWGGGVYSAYGSPTLANCTLNENKGYNGGAACLVNNGPTPQFTNVTFGHNTATNRGDDLYVYDALTSTSLRNCILWGNGSRTIYSNGGSVALSYALIQGGCPAGARCDHILSADPLFVDSMEGDLRLGAGSPAINAGHDAYAVSLATDLAGSPRILGPHVDLGAYEYFYPYADLSLTMSVVPNVLLRPGDALTVTLYLASHGPYTATGVLITDVISYGVSHTAYAASGATVTPTAAASYVWQVEDLAPGAQGIITVTGVISSDLRSDTVFTHTACIGSETMDLVAANNQASAVTYARGPILYVNAAAPPGGTGASWAAAFHDLQSALSVTVPGDEIWVAAGVYTPSLSASYPQYTLDDPHSFTFELKEGMALYGGFRGDETDRARRDWRAYETILSGDLLGNDNPNIALDEPTRQDNAYHVIMAWRTTTLLVDGFTIADANANGPVLPPQAYGAGMYLYNGDATLTHCVFRSNSAKMAGGLYNHRGSPVLTDCVFQGNTALATVDESYFGIAGGLYSNGNPTLIRCVFQNNTASSGGGMFSAEGTRPILTNCVFQGNTASEGGGLFNADSSPMMINCTLGGNTNVGLSNWSGSAPTLYNTILWGNGSAQIDDDEHSSATLDYCLVQGGYITGTHILDADPLFADPANGSLRLRPGSPAIDAGYDAYVTAATDLDGVPRLMGPHVDLGAYETPYADLAITQTLVPSTPLHPGDPLRVILSFANQGSYTATGVLITDILPAHVSWVTVDASGALLTPTGSVSYTWQVAALAPGAGGVITVTGVLSSSLEGYTVFTNTACITSTATADAVATNNQASGVVRVRGPILYVNAVAPRGGAGTSWEDAFADLPSTLAVAYPGDEIWVAAGVYTPTVPASADYFAGDARGVTFQIRDGIRLYGGFQGGEGRREQRDWRAHETILSGDLLGNDTGALSITNTTRLDNARHVVLLTNPASDALLDGFTITGGNADTNPSYGNWDCVGGGVSVMQGKLQLAHAILRDNTAYGDAGLSCMLSSAVLTDVVFSANTAYHAAGALGAMHTSFRMTNVVFTGNAAPSAYVMSLQSVTSELDNITLAGNIATGPDPSYAISLFGGGIAMRNSILWNNPGDVFGVDEHNPLTLSYVLAQGGCPVGATCNQVFDADPRFVGPADGDLRLGAGSPAIDAGNDDYVHVPTDLAGGLRLMGAHVDLGAYEVPYPGVDLSLALSVSPTTPPFPGDVLTYTLRFANRGMTTATGVRITDVIPSEVLDTAYTASGASVTPTGEVHYAWQLSDLAPGAEGSIQITGIVSPGVASGSAFTHTARIADATATEAVTANNQASVVTHVRGPVLYVNAAATGANAGTSWADAYRDLQSALSVNGRQDEIWVATGVYTPTARPRFSGVRNDARSVTFEMRDGLTLYGGFAGHETSRQQRDWRAYETILSGDLWGNDAGVPSVRNATFLDNARHVVLAASLATGALLDGFTISGGNANNDPYFGGMDGEGAGIFVAWGSFRASHIVVRGNAAHKGAGLGAYDLASIVLTDTIFAGNAANYWGGAINALGSVLHLTNAVLTDNWSGEPASAMQLEDATTELDNVTLHGNTAVGGGWALGAVRGSLVMRNSILWGNAGLPVVGQFMSTLALSHVLVSEGCPEGATCDHILDADPRFVDAAQGDLRLGSGSPAIDAGNTLSLPFGIGADLAGNPRVIGPAVDLGAYETPYADLVLHKAVQPFGPVHPGEALTFTLSFSNTGYYAATGVVLTDVVPDGVLLAAYSVAGVSVTPTGAVSYTWAVSDLAPGAGGVITVNGAVSPGLTVDGFLTNTASIGGSAPEAVMTNNTSAVCVAVQVIGPPRFVWLPLVLRRKPMPTLTPSATPTPTDTPTATVTPTFTPSRADTRTTTPTWTPLPSPTPSRSISTTIPAPAALVVRNAKHPFSKDLLDAM